MKVLPGKGGSLLAKMITKLRIWFGPKGSSIFLKVKLASNEISGHENLAISRQNGVAIHSTQGK
jgi:hypothetical protein